MAYYTHYWEITDPKGKKVNAFFIRKKDAIEWIATNGTPDYTITKISMN